MTGIDQCVEPALKAVRDERRVAALEGGDQKIGDVAQAREVVLVGALGREPRRELEHQQARRQDVLEQVNALAQIRGGLEKRREQLERSGLAEVGDGDALAVPDGDEARLLEPADGFAQRVAVGVVLGGELAFTRQAFARRRARPKGCGAEPP